jgi:small-conductance mechanosensitive channel
MACFAGGVPHVLSAATALATNAAPTASTNVVTIPLAEIASQAETTLANLHAIETETESDQSVSVIEEQFPELTQEIAARSEEDARILSHSTSLELFARLERAWQDLSEELSGWNRTLTRRIRQLQANAAHLDQLRKTWELTRDSSQAGNMPRELSQRVQAVLTELKRAGDAVREQLGLVLTLQSRLAEQDARVREAVAALDQGRQQILRHLLARDSPPLWGGFLRTNAVQNLALQGHHSLARQWQELRAYTLRKRERFVLQALIFAILLILLVLSLRKLKTTSADPELARAAQSLGAPLPVALLLSLLLSPWLFPQAPRLLSSVLGIFALVPATFVLRRVLGRGFYGVLNVLVAFYLVDQLRIIAASQPLLWRLLFLAEMAAGAVFCCIWLGAARNSGSREAAFGQTLRVSLKLAAGLFTAVVFANVLGYGRLSSFIGNAVLSAAYLALLLYAVIRLADALVRVIFAVSPLARLGMVQRHCALLLHWVKRLLEWAAVVVWVLHLLERLAIRGQVLDALSGAANSRLSVGSLSFSLGDLLLFIVVLWGAFAISRILRFLLEEEVYPHVQMAPGLHYSISKTIHYVVLLVGFLLALAVLGFNLTKLTILAGAFGVGLGFGMQNIVNNFVSGVILLFERPVKVGDVIQLDTAEGVVKRIGIRASVVRTVNGSEIIVPNAKLISDPVTNWTFSHRRRLITVPIAVASEAEPQRVIDLLTKAATTHPRVSKERPVQALLTNVNNGTTNFELRAWTDQSEDWQLVRSDLYIAIKAALAREKITMH